MRVSVNWLKDFVDITLPIEEIAEKLTMAGMEVSNIEKIGDDWDNVVIGRIAEINPHPNADRLSLPTVDFGNGETASVVCGAPNLAVGQVIPFAKVGARLLDGHTGKRETLKPAKIRGVESSGMVCSEKELGISDRHEGILVLPDDAPLGTALADYLGDSILDIEVTPNRPDCLSVIGIAREVAALTGQPVHIEEPAYDETGEALEGQISIDVQATDLCPRYCASLITNVTIAESPMWMQQRIIAAGMRPINNLVDVTNYVMMEYGQPLHSFDYEKIRGKKIIVRRASDYEPLVTLDGKEHQLDSNMLVIADPMGAVGLAGVMGGANSEVVQETTSILLEAANFNPKSIHYTGRLLDIPSEACMRFERGIRPEIAIPALKRATQLLVELGGGDAAKGIVDQYPGETGRPEISVTPADVRRVVGTDVTAERIEEVLFLLGFACSRSGDVVTSTAPYWRNDINIKEDVIEEIARIIGYDEIPMTMIGEPIPHHSPPPIIAFKRSVVEKMVGYGYYEALSYSLTSRDSVTKLLTSSRDYLPEPVTILNPMSSEQEILRPTLRASMLSVLGSNRRYQDDGIRMFEAQKIYLDRKEELPDEREVLCGILCGPALPSSWLGSGKEPDFYEAKGVVEALLRDLSIQADYVPGDDETLSPSRQAFVVIDDEKVGVLGEVNGNVLKKFDIEGKAYLFELDLTKLLECSPEQKSYKAVSRYPSVVRDMGLVVDSNVSYAQILEIIKGYSLVDHVEIFDLYIGEQVPAGKKSLAYRLTYQSDEHTLTDKEVNKVQEQILKKLEKEVGAILRDQ